MGFRLEIWHIFMGFLAKLYGIILGTEPHSDHSKGSERRIISIVVEKGQMCERTVLSIGLYDPGNC
jgi:hypothetical protein